MMPCFADSPRSSRGIVNRSPFAHRNDALIVRVENVESESTAAGSTWVVTLQSEPVNYGGGFTVDVGLRSQDRSYSADEIAELRARRFLLNDPPPPEEDRHRRGFDPGDSLEMMIAGLNTQYPAKACVFRLLHPGLKDQPQRFMAIARLSAIFALKAGQVFEHITELTLGPIDSGKLHVRCRRKRREVYSNAPATAFEIEGDCPLE